MDSTEILRLVGIIAVLLMVIPGLIYGLRDRRKALRNVIIWITLFVISILLFWLQVRD
ncbi:MAG: hypothetical protein P8M15_03920 [Alphaproteobacteria bacterium]|nr:hypothetical protein [Alphaproteobacteria bacterium]